MENCQISNTTAIETLLQKLFLPSQDQVWAKFTASRLLLPIPTWLRPDATGSVRTSLFEVLGSLKSIFVMRPPSTYGPNYGQWKQVLVGGPLLLFRRRLLPRLLLLPFVVGVSFCFGISFVYLMARWRSWLFSVALFLPKPFQPWVVLTTRLCSWRETELAKEQSRESQTAISTTKQVAVARFAILGTRRLLHETRLFDLQI